MSAGYTDIVTAASGWEALKILDVGRTTDEEPPVDVVLLDIVMPEMDGVEVCARIRNDPRYADLPIIMVTSLDDMNSLANAFVAGATDYVTKPVNRVELVARVRAALQAQAGARPPAGARARIAELSVELGRPPRRPVDRRGDRPVRRRSGRGLSHRRLRLRDRRGDLDPRAHARPLRRLSLGQRRGRRAQRACARWRARCAGSRRRSASWRRPIATA